MTLTGVIALFCVISPNSIALEADYITVVEDRPIMSAKLSSSSYTWPKLSHDLFATAKLFVLVLSRRTQTENRNITVTVYAHVK